MFSNRSLQTEEQMLDDQLELICTDTGCCLEFLPEAMNDRDEWREREGERGES